MLKFKDFLGEDFLRYKHPSLNTMVGLTAIKKGFRKTSGLNTIKKYSPERIKQRVFQHLGIYGNPVVRGIRQFVKGNVPSPFKFLPKVGSDD